MLVTRDGLIVKVLDPDRGQKWLRCIFDGLWMFDAAPR